MSSASPESNDPLAAIQPPVVSKDSSSDELVETSLPSKQAESVGEEANRKLAMVCLVAFTLLFSFMTIFLQRTPVEPSESNSVPPRFVTQIPESSNEEWMLLPGVGEKTASTWRKDLASKTREPRTFAEAGSGSQADQAKGNLISLNSLEDLHGVGPVRAKRLEPYVDKVIVPSPRNKNISKLKFQPVDGPGSSQQRSVESTVPRQDSGSNE